MIVFATIERFPGYRFYTDGSVYSFKQRADGRRLKCAIDGHGYPVIRIRDKFGRPQVINAHRLILEAFVGPAERGQHCCHCNGIKADNRLSNLRWDSPAGNSADRKKHGTQKYGEEHHCAKLTFRQAEAIRMERATKGTTARELAEMYGVSQSTIGYILYKGRYQKPEEVHHE